MARRGQRGRPDDGDDDNWGFSGTTRQQQTGISNGGSNTNKKNEGVHTDLDEIERRLKSDVDSDLFVDPKQFKTLDRVIDVLGSELIDARHDFYSSLSENNPSYRALKKQFDIVEEAIEHMSVHYATQLNSSVVQVGRVARQFADAVNKVRCLKKQVHDIKDNLGAGQANPNEPGNGAVVATSPGGTVTAGATSSARAAAMSLRELWLKKLECEAVLHLISKLEAARLAPIEFDTLVKPRLGTAGSCRIGAAVVILDRAIKIVFSDDVAQVNAFAKITEQLMSRKERAEQIIHDTLSDVLYLRTGNGVKEDNTRGNVGTIGGNTGGDNTNKVGSAAESVTSASSDPSKLRGRGGVTGSGGRSSSIQQGGMTYNNGMKNPFFKTSMRYAYDDNRDVVDNNDDNDDNNSVGSGASLFSRDDTSVASSTKSNPNAGSNTSVTSGGTGASGGSGAGAGGGTSFKTRMMIPYSMIDAELDLEADERRCLEESVLSGVTNNNSDKSSWESVLSQTQMNLPRYADHVLALRILVEATARLNRLDDIERFLHEGMESELRRIAIREQVRTLSRLEKNRGKMNKTTRGMSQHQRNRENLREFRRHLTGLLSSFGCVMIRMSHLAQIVRHRIRSDPRVCQSVADPSTALRSVLDSAYSIIQREIKLFLSACLTEVDTDDPADAAAANSAGSHERDIFSLGIIDHGGKGGDGSGGDGYSKYGALSASRASTVDLPADKFVAKVLLPSTNTTPQVRHALTFRKSLARWTEENGALKRELAYVTGEDTTSPSYNAGAGETSLDYLDVLIQKNLLPVLQEDAVQGTVQALEREDAFDPVFERNLYARTSSNEPQDVDMCLACSALYVATAPLFMALHRLPPGGEMYLPLVAVLEHVMLTFISRVKQRVGHLSANKAALSFMLDSGGGSREHSLDRVMERRRAFAQLLQAYADGDLLESQGVDGFDKNSNLMPISPPSNDTKAKNAGDDAPVASDLDLAGGVEREEQNLKYELAHLSPLLEFTKDFKMKSIVVCQDEELMKAATLAHSLMKLSSLLESRLKVKDSYAHKPLTNTRALREAIKTINSHGIKMAKFCRVDMILQTVTRLSKICKSSTIVAKDAVRLPSCVNDLGEYLTGASDNLREAGGNAVTAYTFSSLEQYIPLFLMENVRLIGKGQGIVAKAPLTLNGIEALDRSGSVLYRDLKGATSFDNSFWDDELAAVSFERSASFMAMMELEMDELEAYFRANQNDFSDKDFQLMFEMNGPRRRGDIGRYNMMKRKLKK